LPSKHIDTVKELSEPTESITVWLSEHQKSILQQLVKSSSVEARLVERAKILIMYEQKESHKGTARALKMDPKTVRKWCHRWQNCLCFLQQLENQFQPFSERVYRAAICEVLQDTPRSGAPDTFTVEQRTQIIAMACEVLDDSDEPVSRWTPEYLAKEAMKRGIVSTISRSSVARILREIDLKPHSSRYWLNAPERGTEKFVEDVETVCELYKQAETLHEEGIHLLSTDEKTGIQALEREHPTHPAEATLGKGQELCEYNYERHGTLCLIANFEVATGKILAPTIGQTRTEMDFAAHIAQTVANDPTGKWIFIADQLNTHLSASLVHWIVEQEQLNLDLGEKGKSGILQSMETRKEFLSAPERRIRFIYTPKHASWLNQIEIWFSILTRRLLKRGSFSSQEVLQQRILKFIQFFNDTLAKPFAWTFTGKILKA
jgi:transposase